MLSTRLILTAFLMAAFAAGQSKSDAFSVELAVPFGTAPGKLLLLPDYVVFVDEAQPASSFVIPLAGVKESKGDGMTVTIRTQNAITDRSGERNSVSLRLPGETETKALLAHLAQRQNSGGTGGGRPESTSTAPRLEKKYDVTHEHRLRGGCTGQLVFTDQGIIFESVNEVNHSRRYTYSDVKELTLKDPYRLDLDPFQGDKLNFRLAGNGMESVDYRKAVDRITSARISK